MKNNFDNFWLSQLHLDAARAMVYVESSTIKILYLMMKANLSAVDFESCTNL